MKAEVMNSFSMETQRELEERGYVVDRLTGCSVEDLIRAGHKIWWAHKWYRDPSRFEHLKSRFTQVAFHPKRFVLPESRYLDWNNQQVLVRDCDAILGIPDAEVVVGELPEYTELFLRYLRRTRRSLIGSCYIRTNTLVTPRIGVNIGGYVNWLGLHISHRRLDTRDGGVAPLIIPRPV